MNNESCEHMEHHYPIGVGEDEDGPFVVVECEECREWWEEYREWSISGDQPPAP